MANDPFHSDRPIETDEQDRFGFSALAGRLAEALTTQSAGKGFVMGVEGRWGCGKSSLLALTIARLRQMDRGQVALVEFRPWLIGDRDQLLTGLFEDFAKAIANLELEGGDASGVTALGAKRVAEQARNFARHLGPIGKLVGLAGSVVPGIGIAGKALEALAQLAREVENGPSLADQKAALSEALVKLDCRIVVVIDDVDRLDPSEVAELLRLVRSVADFPNVSYLLCYDMSALAHAIQTATGVRDGAAYLEKIVQTEIGVPRPEAFALRRWFSAELQTFAACDTDRAPDLLHVISEGGGRSFDTPRSVVRTLDSLRAYWPGLEGKVDIVDLTWIRIIAIASPALYRWIEEYVTICAALASGRVHIGQAERLAMETRLDHALETDGLEWEQVRFELANHLPHVNVRNYDKAKAERVFAQSDQREAARNFRNGRLSSPSHSRLYFTLVEPTDAVSSTDIAELVAAGVKGANDVAALFLRLSEMIGDAGGSKAERLLNELLAVDDEVIKAWPLEAILIGFTNVADQLSEDERGDEWGYPRIWTNADELLKRLSRILPAAQWDTLISLIYQHGQSLGYVSHLLRHETFMQGFHGNRSNPNERLVSAELYQSIRQIMLERYGTAGLDRLLGNRHTITMLYAWSQAGGRDELVGLIRDRSVEDAHFLAILRAICGTSTGSHGVNFTLSLDAVHAFFNDPPAVARRAIRLAQVPDPSTDAVFVKKAMEGSAHFYHSGDIEAAIRAWNLTPDDSSEKAR